jgi:mono/diheme cytochrome c family protein
MKQETRRITIFVIVAIFILALGLAACQSATPTPAASVAKPSKPGGAGQAVSLSGDATKGAVIYTANCTRCHGDQGKVGVANAGSTDGTIPVLNPIDASLISGDAKTNITNIDLFVEHGSVPAGTNPALSMPGFGDDKTLQPQEIADVIAYVISLNKK